MYYGVTVLKKSHFIKVYMSVLTHNVRFIEVYMSVLTHNVRFIEVYMSVLTHNVRFIEGLHVCINARCSAL